MPGCLLKYEQLRPIALPPPHESEMRRALERTPPMRVDNVSDRSQIQAAPSLEANDERYRDAHPPLSHLDALQALGDQRPEFGHRREPRPHSRERTDPGPAAARPYPGRRRDLQS